MTECRFDDLDLREEAPSPLKGDQDTNSIPIAADYSGLNCTAYCCV